MFEIVLYILEFLFVWSLFAVFTFILDVRFSNVDCYDDIRDCMWMYFAFGALGFVVILFMIIYEKFDDRFSDIMDKVINKINKLWSKKNETE